MALARSRRRETGGNYWPGFVDAMATLLLVVTFLLSMFMIVQYFVTQESSGKDTALQRLNRQIAQLTELLALEQGQKQSLQQTIASLRSSLGEAQSENKRLQGIVGIEGEKSKTAGSRIEALESNLAKQQNISSDALAQVELLNQQLSALRRQIGALQEALSASEQRDQENQARISDLGRRLNVALAKKVQELSRYRSEFFGRLRDVLGSRENVEIVGDRFVFQAEVLFPSGSDQINVVGQTQMIKLASVLKEIENDIPSEINWVLRIDGHTDIRPIATAQFPSNWELSSARAISVVKFLISEGVEADRLVAAGFGQFQPLDNGSSEEALRRNRRIELKLTEK
ncbi:MAG: peptidoglycan -binding protein [Methyloligellaceae bacterium]